MSENPAEPPNSLAPPVPSQADKATGEVREIFPYRLEHHAARDGFDFRPVVEEAASSPKDSSAPEPVVSSSEGQAPVSPSSESLEETVEPTVEKDSTPPKAPSPGLPTGLQAQKVGKTQPTAET